MKWSIAVAVAMLTAAPLAAQSQKDRSDWTGRPVTVRGCVKRGVDKGHYVMTNVSEVVPSGASAMPEFAHGRRVIFWLEDLPNLKKHENQMVDVSGKFTSIKESEIEVKAGHQGDGGLVVEFEGPGSDVKASAATLGSAIGTAGAVKPEADDIKTYLIRIDVDQVKMVSAACQ